ncbi:MAG: HAMP domain-containing histidine kinase [Oscillospiraceae bacterium]|nr:HAMP domain-containing histidine kinase [Oscillospiraceae bacterium]
MKKRYGLKSAAAFLALVLVGVQVGLRVLWLWSALGGPGFARFEASDHYLDARQELVEQLTDEVNELGLEGFDQTLWDKNNTNLRYEVFLYSADRYAQERNMVRLENMGLAPGEYLTVADFQSDGSYRLLRAATNLPEDKTMTDLGLNGWGMQGRGEFEDSTILIRYGVEMPLTVEDALMDAQRDYENDRVRFYIGLGAVAVLGVCCAAALVVHLKQAGRQADGSVALNWMDRIPLDALVLAVLVLLLWPELTGYYYSFGSPLGVLVDFLYTAYNVLDMLGLTMLGVALGSLGAGLLVLLPLRTLAVRVHSGTLWQNTLLRRLRDALHRAAAALPLMWRTVLWAGGLVLAELAIMLYVNSWVAWHFPFFFYFLMFLPVLALAVGQIRQTGQLASLRGYVRALAEGRLTERPDTRGLRGEYLTHARDLARVGEGLSRAVEERMKSERLKTELITNVSHDLKTPLTSIVNYVDLLQKEPLEPRAAEYVQVLARQSTRLKKLTEDLVEASKASTGNLPVKNVPTDVAELLGQAAAEYELRLTEAQLTPVLSVQPGLRAVLDGRLMWRVMDNLLGNVCKYALPGTRVYLGARQFGGAVEITVKNVSAQALNVSPDELMERFVRGDASRSTEGSGLGLSIAKSLVQVQGGRLDLTVDGDLFKVSMTFAVPAEQPAPAPQEMPAPAPAAPAPQSEEKAAEKAEENGAFARMLAKIKANRAKNGQDGSNP